MKKYTIAKYIRLSMEDLDLCDSEEKAESVSISNQRNFINVFMEQKEEFKGAEVREFVDDGYSGTNFDRPAMKEMLRLCKQGEINCIIVKDLSRFGRNYLEVGDYLEQIFPFLGIRFISINDGFDSKNFFGQTGGMDVAFKNFIYEMYSRDLSEKVKSGVTTCMKRGEYYAGCMVYGYQKSSDGKRMEEVDEVAYQYMDPYPGRGKVRGAFWNLDQVSGKFYFKQTLKFLDKIKPDIIILYEPNSILYVLKMLNLSKKEGFKLVIETTEWRNPKDYRGIIPRVINTEKDLQKKYIDKKVGNVIAISKYLYQHYLEQNCNTILLPPIFPEADKKKKLIRENSDNRKVLKIVYAGALASKDYIDTLLHAIIRLNTDEVRVVIDIIGPDKMQVQKLVGNDELEKYGIYCHGRLSHDKTLSIVEKADLSVLLRMNKRYAKAGVSTKFCEAMMLGVPSICTSVGGTDLFIKDKYNGFLVRDNDLNTLEATLLDIISLSRDQIEEIKNNALTTANELFTPDKYIEQFNAFLNKCK